MPPGGVDQRLFERFPLDPAPPVRVTYVRTGAFRTKTVKLNGRLTDLSLDGAAIDLDDWEPEDGTDMRLHLGPAEATIEIRSLSRRPNGSFRLHVRFRNPPEDFRARVQTFADHMAAQRRAHLARARRNWAASESAAEVRSF